MQMDADNDTMDADNDTMDADDDTMNADDDTMNADNTDNMAGTSQTSNSVMLNYILKHLRTSDERSVKIASEVNMLSKTLISALEVGVLRTNHVALAQTLPVTPPTVRNVRPGTFRESVPDTKHKSLKDTQFHVSSLFSNNGDLW